MTKTVLVVGASGTVGQGVLKATLEKGYRAVGVFRSVESAEKTRTHLGNPPKDKFITVVGTLTSDESAAELQKAVVAQAGEITDVVASIGGLGRGVPKITDYSLEEFKNIVGPDKLDPHFLSAKYFLPLVNKEGTSYTVINGAGGIVMPYIPNMGLIVIQSGSLNKLAALLIGDNKDGPTRINEFVIVFFVKQWDDMRPDDEVLPPIDIPGGQKSPPPVTNVVVGNAVLGVIDNPVSRGETLIVTSSDALEQLTTTGKL